jgi:hypothetical protein
VFSAAVFILLVSTGGFIQLFWGDVENYSITAVLVIWYLLLGARVIKKGTSSWVAAVFLLPSLAYPATKHHSERKQKLLYAAVAVLIPFALVLLCMLPHHDICSFNRFRTVAGMCIGYLGLPLKTASGVQIVVRKEFIGQKLLEHCLPLFPQS